MSNPYRCPKGTAATLVFALALATVECVGCAGAKSPRDMSVAENQAAAEADEKQAERKLCAAPADAADTGPCWGAQSAQTRHEVVELRRKAAEHRNAAAVLTAEEEACSGVSEADRVQSPFSHQEDIVSVQPLLESRPQGGTREAGAVILFRKVPRLTATVFQKIIDCHLARDAAFGFDLRELEYCPLSVNPLGFRKLKATVTERAHGFAVRLDAEDEKVARQVLSRAQLLVGPPRCLQTPVLNEST